MRTLRRGTGYGEYPANRRFGPFRVSYEEDLSEMVTREKFLYANTTASAPPGNFCAFQFNQPSGRPMPVW